MRVTRIRAGITAGALALAGAAAAVSLAAAPASAVPALSHPAAATTVVLVNQCPPGQGLVKPKGIINLPGCMGSQQLIQHATWTSWASVAFGSADFTVNNCNPSASCGPSKFTKYPVLMVLWKAKHWTGGNGHEDYFSRMTVIFTGKRPSGSGPTLTLTWAAAAK